ARPRRGRPAAPRSSYLLVPSAPALGTRNRDFPAGISYPSTEEEVTDEIPRGDGGADPGGVRRRGGAQAGAEAGGESRAEGRGPAGADAREARRPGARAHPRRPRPPVVLGDPDEGHALPGGRREARVRGARPRPQG